MLVLFAVALLMSNSDSLRASLHLQPTCGYLGQGSGLPHLARFATISSPSADKYPKGLQVEVKDSYPSVMEDLQRFSCQFFLLVYNATSLMHLQALKAVGQIWLLSNMDSQEDIVYPNDPKVMIKVDDDIKQHFREIKLSRDTVDVEKELEKNDMKPATNMAKRRVTAQFHGITSLPKPKKKREITKRTKLTNAHLPELFQN
ncbi:hypothetical protein BHE74_00020848 [Ensete ventricosum]|nr:hypothetical protein BHE74_00020848 [Ensete ventricosum]